MDVQSPVALFLFLVQVFIISISGAMQPGPVTATAITMGVRNRWAGVLLAVGHGIIEFPLMVLIIVGLGAIFQLTLTQIIIGFAGGLILILMAIAMFKTSSTKTGDESQVTSQGSAVLAGIVLTASNPYFLIWWATVGLVLATKASEFGLYAFALFAIVHWFVDLIWVTALSFASFHGTTLLGPKSQTIILKICAAAMLLFGLFFIYNAASMLIRTPVPA